MARCSSVGPFWTQPVPWLLFSNTPFLKNGENSHTSRLVSWRPPSDLRGESEDDNITWNRFLRYRWKIITLESAVSVFAGFYTRFYLQVVSALRNHPFISVSKQFLWRKFQSCQLRRKEHVHNHTEKVGAPRRMVSPQDTSASDSCASL